MTANANRSPSSGESTGTGNPAGLWARLGRAYRGDMTAQQRAALLSWLGFTATFATVRLVTHAIRAGLIPLGNFNAGGKHLHHYLWGIGMLTGVGGLAIHGTHQHGAHPAVALTYGAGLALIVDEFAVLLDLQDVYWAQRGRLSVDLGVGTASLGGTVVAALPLLTHVRRPNR